MARLKSWLQCAALLAAAAAGLAVAVLVLRASGPAAGIVRNLELASARAAALIGEPEPDDAGEPVTIARLVATADGTVVLVRPVLRESARTVKATREPLAEAAETIRAARPVLGAAKQAIDRTEPMLAAATGTIERTGTAAEAAIKNASDSWDAMYWDVQAAVESGTVAARGIAEAADAAGKSAPETARHVQRLAEQSAGIATDVHVFTAKFTAPTPWYKRVLNVALGGLVAVGKVF